MSFLLDSQMLDIDDARLRAAHPGYGPGSSELSLVDALADRRKLLAIVDDLAAQLEAVVRSLPQDQWAKALQAAGEASSRALWQRTNR